jgi:hypothetical protein
MATTTYHEILAQIELLSLDEQQQLLENLIKHMRRQVTNGPRHSILELQGLGNEVWEGIDVDTYIAPGIKLLGQASMILSRSPDED